MLDKIKVAAMVTLYNSSYTSLINIETYRPQILKLFVVDNSELYSKELIKELKSFPNVSYIPNDGNEGIGVALNRAAIQASEEGYDYLLTMDDDSRTPSDLIPQMIEFLRNYPEREQVGIVSASHGKPSSTEPWNCVLTTMTSGNLLNLSIYRKIGPFRNDFFIDHIDHDYCLRLKMLGYQVIELPYISLEHKLGVQKTMGWFRRKYVSHAPIRVYYYVRNGIILLKEYKKYFPAYCFHLRLLIVKEILKALFFDTQKILRLRMALHGLNDAYRGKMGKLTRK